jgi:hypothetical protein
MQTKADIVAAIERQRKKATAKNSTLESTLDLVSFSLVFVNLPAAVVLGTACMGMKLIEDQMDIAKHPMPDTWLQQVSDWEGISPEGLAYLSKCLTKRGHITVKEALSWMEMEEKITRKAKELATRQATLQGQGAVSLLIRAKRECPKLIDLTELTNRLQALELLAPVRSGVEAATQLGGKIGGTIKGLFS